MRFTCTSKNEVLILCFRKIRKMIRESKNIGMCSNFFFSFLKLHLAYFIHISSNAFVCDYQRNTFIKMSILVKENFG